MTRPAEQGGGGWRGHCLTTAVAILGTFTTMIAGFAALIWSVTT